MCLPPPPQYFHGGTAPPPPRIDASTTDKDRNKNEDTPVHPTDRTIDCTTTTTTTTITITTKTIIKMKYAPIHQYPNRKNN